MYTRKNWVKHWDFIVLDLIMLELSFLIANFIRYRQGIRANIQMNRYIFYTEIVILVLCFFMTIVFDNPYKNILKNDASEEVVRLDREYIENWSIKEDIKILLKTVIVVLTHKGAE